LFTRRDIVSDPFKKDEPISVFKKVSNSSEQAATPQTSQQKEQQEYSQFPSWDLLPPFKLVRRGKKK
jgi:hypothetical protein